MLLTAISLGLRLVPTLSDQRQTSALENSARLNARIGWIRLPIVFAFGGMILGLANAVWGLGWLVVMLVVERATTWIRLRLASGDLRMRRPYLIAIAGISAMWVAAALLLWSADTEVSRMAAVVCLLITALAGVVGGQKDRVVSVLLLAPPLGAFFLLLSLHLIAHAPLLAAVLGIVAIIGACISVVSCAVVLQASDRNLTRKNAELERVTRALAESKAFLEQTTAVAKVGGWRFDPATQEVEWSPEARCILGIDVDAPATIELGLSVYAPESQPVIVKALRDALQTEAPWVREVALAPQDGAPRWVRVSGKLANVDGVQILIGAVQDVTERVRLEDELLQAQKLEAIGRLTGGVAHDFNNVLTAILSSAELLENAPEQRTSQLGGAIAKAATRAGELTTKLLAYSRRQILNPSVIDLNVAVEEALALMRPMLDSKIEIRCALHPAPVWSMLDPAQLANAILNLAINAADAMPNGGALLISTSINAAGRTQLEVIDTGIGIAPDVAAKVFDPFFTTKTGGLGTGLGLSMVHGFVNQSGGEIELESKPGQGARFTLTFPAADAAPPRLHTPARAKATQQQHARVLLIDDDDLVREALARTLVEHGFTIAAANGRESALKHIEAGVFDIAIIDVALGPDESGADLAQTLLAHRPNLKVMLISGHTQEKLSADMRTISFLQKPFSHAALLDGMNALLEPAPARANGN